MGMLDRILGRTNDGLATRGQYIPADQANTALSRAGNSILDGGNAIANRAVQYYKENPRKVQLAGLLAAAALLTKISQGRR